jgi:hypothetical protein
MFSTFRCKPAPPAGRVIQDPEILRKLTAIRHRLEARGEDTWEDAMAIREQLRDILVATTTSENDYLICRGVWDALLDTLRQTAINRMSSEEFDNARRISEEGADFIHYVLNPLQGMPPESAATWGLQGKTSDGRAVFPLLQKFMPEAADKLLNAARQA